MADAEALEIAHRVVAVDGSRGSGKSRLAVGLRERFDCGVLEVGPLFRLCAWLTKSGQATDPVAAADVLRNRLQHSQIQVDTENASAMSAMRIVRVGYSDDLDLWDPELNPVLRSLAARDDVVQRVGQVVRGLVDRPLVVVGREAGSEHFFPKAPLKVLLRTEESVRFDRKAAQIAAETGRNTVATNVDDPEPDRRWQHGRDVFVIDTSTQSPEDVLAHVSARIEQSLGWARR